MNVERLRKIIAYSEKNREETNALIKKFCAFTGLEYENDVLNIMQIVRSSFHRIGYWIFEMPFSDDEIGALSYKGDGLGYVVVNSSLPRVNVNFAIAHEIYHVFFQNSEFVSKIEFSNENYYEHEEEYAANLFAAMLLMPEISFRRMYLKFREESAGNELDTFMKLMAYYQVPYMAVFIRCCMLGLIADQVVSAELFQVTREKILEKFEMLWLDDSILYASKKDEFPRIAKIVESLGKDFVEGAYISQRAMNKSMKNMRELYQKIKGE